MYVNGDNVIYKDEYVKIFTMNNDVLAETYKRGFRPEQLYPVLQKYPQVAITGMDTLRNMLLVAPSGPKKIGEFRNRIHLDISPDALTANITFYMTRRTVLIGKERLKSEVALLKQRGCIRINLDSPDGDPEPFHTYTAVRGIPAEDGADAVIRMYERLKLNRRSAKAAESISTK